MPNRDRIDPNLGAPATEAGASETRPGERVRHHRRLPTEFLERCRQLRHNTTDAEQLLWQLLRNRQLDSFKFRRQVPLGGYILDFYCPAARLAVELDGSIHAKASQAAYDHERDANLAALPIRVLRLWNGDVLDDPETVLCRIRNALRAPSEQAAASPSGCPVLRPPSLASAPRRAIMPTGETQHGRQRNDAASIRPDQRPA